MHSITIKFSYNLKIAHQSFIFVNEIAFWHQIIIHSEAKYINLVNCAYASVSQFPAIL